MLRPSGEIISPGRERGGEGTDTAGRTCPRCPPVVSLPPPASPGHTRTLGYFIFDAIKSGFIAAFKGYCTIKVALLSVSPA